jgi:hypothetical protein
MLPVDGEIMNADMTRSAFQIQVGGVSGQVAPESASSDFIDGTADKLDAVANAVEVATQSFMEKLSALKVKPSECTLEFGVNVGGEAGIPFITKGTAGANFKVALKWAWK